MKRITSLMIVVWSVLFVIGIVFALLGILVSFLAGLFWVFAILAWIGDAVWITLVVVKGRRKARKGGSALVGNQAVFQRMRREADEAISRYFSAVNRKGFFRRSALYERPWFLLCGTRKSGKSSLLRGSGLNFPLRYPSERDGVVVEGGNQVMWYFGNEAVWIDTPGSFMEESGKDEWQSLVEALRRVRSDCPVDGVALVVSIGEVLDADDSQIKATAQRLRVRIDELIARWGIEFPVYLLLSRTDEIPGFKEYFSEQIASGDDQILGATITQKGEASTPRIMFAEEFSLLCKSLTDFRLDRLYKERDQAKKRMICRFVIHFQSVQQKLAALTAELFKASSYSGKPIFRGFYFTSCGEKKTPSESGQRIAGSEVSSTIVNHPLNPHRILGASQKNAEQTVSKPELQTLFVLPLFRDIMVRDKPLVKATRSRSRREMLQHYVLFGGIALAALLFSAYLISGYARIARFYEQASTVFSRMPSENAPLLEQYLALDIMQGIMGRLQRYDDHTPLSMGIGLYRGRPLLRAIKGSYFLRLKRCLIAPAVKYLEYDIRNRAESFGELNGDDYDKLYRSLKAYLSISEAGASHLQNIDTAFLRPVLFDAVRQSVMSSLGTDRLPEKIEMVLQGNMGLLLTYLRRGEFPAIQENQRMVTEARSRLRRLPGAEAIYDAVIGQLTQNTSSITLDELLGRQGAGILVSATAVSDLYTQKGWNKTVSAALKEAAENPYKVDWVMGFNAEETQQPSFDKAELFSDMERAYLSDFVKRWCAFLAAIDIEPPTDLPQSARMLQKLVGDQSEIQKLLESVGKVTEIKDQSMLSGALKVVAAKVKAASDAAKKAKNDFSFAFGGTASPFDDVNGLFDQLRSFASSGGGYTGYKEKVLALADKLSGIEAGGDNQIFLTFSGHDDDPLYTAWKYTQNTVGVMPEALAKGLGTLLLKPLEKTGAAASPLLSRILNARWQNEVEHPFVSHFSGRYPFSGRGEDASWNDVMDFFRPSAGTFWGFYDRALSSYIVKNSSGWMVRQLGGLQFNFNPDLSAALTGAETIKNIFFKPDGTLRAIDITLTPAASNKNTGRLEVDGQTFDLANSKSIRFSWPIEGQGRPGGASLKVMVSKDFWQDISYTGQWGVMKLISAAKIDKQNNSIFYAKWQVNVQNMYMLNFEARIQVSSPDHPFTDPVFQQFNCPADLIVTSVDHKE
ncbi:MAG: type VI secretion system membrane subunit TssM [Chitinispirillaceae bacterium]|jgi:type VI secretion system protein ImpL